jgi:hypothetical protein
MRKLQERYAYEPLFPSSAYSTGTINCGPATVCHPHYDRMNYPSGPCAITAMGPNFDPSKGGHLILFELGVYLPFPSGSTILISSACFLHGNSPLQPGEERCSFTQFIPGRLMQWVAHKFQCSGELDEATREELDLEAEEGLEAQLGRLSLVHELVDDRAKVWSQEPVNPAV